MFSSSIPIDESFSSFETEMETLNLPVPIWQDYLFIVLHDDPVKRSFLKTHSLDCNPRLSWSDLKDCFIKEYLTEMDYNARLAQLKDFSINDKETPNQFAQRFRMLFKN
jgi:hypothetical protein